MKQGFWKCCLRTPESSPPGLFRLSSRVALFHNNTGLPFHFVDIYTDSTKAMKGNVGALEWTKAAVPNYPSSHCILHHHALQFPFTCLFIGCAGSLQLCTGFLWLWRVRPALWLRCGGTSLWDEAPHCETRHPTMRRGISLWCEASPCEMRCLTVRGGASLCSTGWSWLQPVGSAVVVHGHVGSAWTRDQINVPWCVARNILNDWATMEAPKNF